MEFKLRSIVNEAVGLIKAIDILVVVVHLSIFLRDCNVHQVVLVSNCLKIAATEQ